MEMSEKERSKKERTEGFIMAAVLREQKERQERMYGCTVADLRESVEQSITYQLSGPAMVAMGMLSDCQEMLAQQNPTIPSPHANEWVRQALNRAKWVMSTYMMNVKEAA